MMASKAVRMLFNYVSVTSYDPQLPEGKLNEIGVYIDRKGASIPPEFKLTHDRKAALVKVKVKYPFGMLRGML